MSAFEILKAVAISNGVEVSDIKSRSRKSHLIRARVEFIRRATTERKMSAAQIGRFINRSEWTVRYHRSPLMRARKLASFQALARSKADV